MADIVAELAAKCNLNADMVRNGLGAILSFLKSKLPTEAFSKLSAAVPNSESMMAAAQSAPEASGGVMDAVKGAVGKIFGGGGEVIAKLSKLGFSTDQLAAFLPKVLEFFRGRIPADVLKQVEGHLPIPETADAH